VGFALFHEERRTDRRRSSEGTRCHVSQSFANAPKKGGIWRLIGRRREGRPNKEGDKNSREEEENKKSIEVKEWKGQENINHVFYILRNFVINKKC